MKVKDIMTKNPACCTPGTSLLDVARLMKENDCGEIPVVESERSLRPVGVITDRDVVVRCLAAGVNPMSASAGDCMTTSPHTVKPDASIEECCRVMEDRQVRRVPVVDGSGKLVGMVSQADVARNASERDTAEVVREISKPDGAASAAHAGF